MADNQPLNQPQVIRLGESSFTDAIKILSMSFRNDPMILHMFPTQKLNHKVDIFFEFLLMKAKFLNESLYGLMCDGKLAGIACMLLPSPKKPSIPQILAFIYQCLLLMLRIPFVSFMFINEYMKLTSSARLKHPHHYLSFIAVGSSYQGKGYGRLLLNHLHALVKSESISHGVGLDTENPDNVALYEHFGYKVTQVQSIGPVTIYNMFKATDN